MKLLATFETQRSDIDRIQSETDISFVPASYLYVLGLWTQWGTEESKPVNSWAAALSHFYLLSVERSTDKENVWHHHRIPIYIRQKETDMWHLRHINTKPWFSE